MTLYHVPHLSLGAELSDDFHERTTVVAYRYFSSYIGHLTTYSLGFLVFFVATPEFENGQFNRDAYGPFALAHRLRIMVVTILWSAIRHGRVEFLFYLQQPTAQMQHGAGW